MPMDRPRSTLGLAAHLVRVRWQQLSSRGRMLAGVAIAATAVGTAAAVHMAVGGCCAGGCPAERARLEAETQPVAAVDATAEAHDGCASAH